MTKKVGFIGMGIMGAAMARNLMKNGFAVVVHSRTKEKAAAVLGDGAGWADSPAELARDADFVCTAVDDGAAVRSVLLGRDGVIDTVPPHAITIDFSTIAPSEARSIGAVFAERSRAFVDAPVSGGDVGAREARLSIMAGGSAEAFEGARPVFDAVGRSAVRFGPAGAGQLMKAVNQVAVALSVLAMAESFTFARAAGLPMDEVLGVLQGGAAGSWSLSNYGPRVLREDFAPGFSIRHMTKDLGIVLQEAEILGVALPGVDLVRRLYEELVERGEGGLGNHGLVRRYEAG